MVPAGSVCACAVFAQHSCVPGRHVATLLALSAVSSLGVQEEHLESAEDYRVCIDRSRVSEILGWGCGAIYVNKHIITHSSESDTSQSGKTCPAS